jgi:hypothetical protein
MDFQPDLTFAACHVVLRACDLLLPHAADTSGPRILREADATGGTPR